MQSPEVPNSRVQALNAWVKDAVVNGKRAFYDRTHVLSKEHTQIDLHDEGATVSIPHRNVIKQRFENLAQNIAVSGTCRELAQWAAARLVKEGVVDDAQVYACATPKEAHYVVIAVLDGKKYLVDIAYSQPILEAIPVDGQNHVSDEYADKGNEGEKQGFIGQVTYNAQEAPDGVHLKIDSTEGRKNIEFPFKPLTDELDAQIPGMWAHATGSGYATVVRKNRNGAYRVDKLGLGPEATLEDEFQKVHEKAEAFGARAIDVVFRDDELDKKAFKRSRSFFVRKMKRWFSSNLITSNLRKLKERIPFFGR